MTDRIKVWQLIILIVLILIALSIVSFNHYGAGYRSGQIDAINGIVKYELLKQPDGSTDWVERE